MLILVAISVRIVIGDNGILNSTISANKSYYVAKKKEEVNIAVLAELADKKGDKTQVQISNVLADIKKGYSSQAEKDAIIAEATGEEEDRFPGTITYNPPASGIKDVIVITVDENLNVIAGLEEPDEYSLIPKVTPLASENMEVNGIYYNAPDLTGFDPASTYYVTYDSTGQNEKIAGRIDRVTPEGNLIGEGTNNVWHDYGNKVWANVVTVKGDDVTYWVWIPRYVYKKDGETSADVKFVEYADTGAGYKELYYEDVNNVKTSTAILEQELEEGEEPYALPECFNFGNSSQDMKYLKGYWISKYKVQDDKNVETMYVTTKNGVKTIKTTKTNDVESTDTYTIYVEGIEYDSGVTIPYTMTGLKKNKEYDICLVNETQKKMIGRTPVPTQNIQIDLTGFDKNNTYYVLYDESGNNEVITDIKVDYDGEGNPTNIPDREQGVWYNYSNKIWANVVTKANDEIAYWTYIPRYEYLNVTNDPGATMIQFIPVSKTTATNGGWKIPDSFRFGTKDLKGYWISKYKVQ